MEDSILKSTKGMLGIEDTFTAFDFEIAVNINTTFSILHQLGVAAGAPIEADNEAKWSELQLPATLLNMVKTYIFLRVKMTFDPPGTSYLLEAAEKQIAEHEQRMLNLLELPSLQQ